MGEEDAGERLVGGGLYPLSLRGAVELSVCPDMPFKTTEDVRPGGGGGGGAGQLPSTNELRLLVG